MGELEKGISDFDVWLNSVQPILVEEQLQHEAVKHDDVSGVGVPTFAEFAKYIYPFIEVQPFHENYYRLLEYFAAGRIRKLMVSMPP